MNKRLDEIKARLEKAKNPEQCHLIEARLILCADMEWLIKKLEIAQKALEFYAETPNTVHHNLYEIDCGAKAKKALEEMQ